MADNLTTAEQNALLWPIKAKGEVSRLNPLGDPTIEKYYHKALEQGRFLENSIGDANHLLLLKMQLLTKYITSYTHMNSLAVDGQLPGKFRSPKYVADSISILQTSYELTTEIYQLIQAIESNINTLLAIEQSMLALVQGTLNSIANLLNNICNWGLPAIPSIPNLFPEQLWNWNGFSFSPLALFAAFLSNTNFNFNFTFANCSLGASAAPSTYVGNPITTTSNSGLTFGSASYYTPPYGGSVVPAGQSLTDPGFVASMQANTSDPVLSNTANTGLATPAGFNPNLNMWGALPDPHYVLSNWQLLGTAFDNLIVSIVPSLRANTVFVGDPDYSNPNTALRDLQLRKDLIHNVNLGNIQASNFDPLLTSAWLIYANLARQARGGQWIPAFETAFQQYVQPSLNAVTSLGVPWNDCLGFTDYIWMSQWSSTIGYIPNDIVTYQSGTWLAIADSTDVTPGTDQTMWVPAPPQAIYSNAPVIPLLQTFAGLTPDQLNHALWQLSYVEASLLGYSRNPQWDSYQDNSYLNGATGSDLDYQPTAVSASSTPLTLGTGTAEFPVPVTFPTSFQQSVNDVIAQASGDIALDLAYISPSLANRFTYNQFAVATQVDRFSQFWRDFAMNLRVFLAQDPYLVQFAATYPEILNGAVNPLGDPTAYNSLLADASSRSRSWTPGTPLLAIPVEPVLVPPSGFSPDVNDNGWVNDMDFDPVAFLSRPDIQSLPIPVQIAMLRTNLSYAGIQTWKSNMQAAIADNIATANALLAATTQVGFHVSVYTTVTPVPSGTNAQVAFDGLQLPQDFDNTGNVTTINPGLFTIQEAGTYNGLGTFVWQVPSSGIYTITVTQNGTAIATASSNAVSGTTTTNVTFNQAFASGDVVKVFASTNLSSGTADIEPGSFFSMLLADVSASSGGNTGSQGNTRNYKLDVPFWFPGGGTSATVPFLTAVSVDAAGNATPIDPSVPTVTSVQSSGSSVFTLTTTANNFKTTGGDLVTFTGFQFASFLNGQVVTTTSATPTSLTFTFAGHASYGPTAEGAPAAILYAIDSSGAVLAPNPDGVTLAAGTQGQSVATTAFYGDAYVVTPITTADQIVVGGLLYVGLDGRLTQDYTSLTTGSPQSSVGPVGWIICIGRVIAYDGTSQTMTFIYEPHVPTRFSSMI